jgi:CYTH domain-containing protein
MVEEPDGAIYKMTQKIRVVADEPEKVRITNVYLSANEFDLLCILPSTVVSKRRWTVVAGDLEFAVDVFRGRHEGLVLAERELGDDEDRVTIPDFADLEVTNDNDYSGGSLSSASDDEIHRLISAVSDVRRGA